MQADHDAEGAAAPSPKPRRDEALVRELLRAHRSRRRIESGKARSITDLAEQQGVTAAYVGRLLRLTCLAPDIVEAILDGGQPKGLRLAEMLGDGPLLGWEEQRALLVSAARCKRCYRAEPRAFAQPKRKSVASRARALDPAPRLR